MNRYLQPAILALCLTVLLTGCQTSRPVTTAVPAVKVAVTHCPLCHDVGKENTLCQKCRDVFTTEGETTCAECGTVRSGTWCAKRQAFHFSDDGSKCCGRRRGEWDNQYRCGKFVGLDDIVFCENCEIPYPRGGSCPKCRK